MMGLIEIKFDGACYNQKDKSSEMGIGVAVFFDNEYIPEESIALKIIPEYVRGTSNIAEWEACLEAWKKAIELSQKYPGNKIKIYSDSQVIANQFNGTYSINNPSFHSYRRMAVEYSERISGSNIIWISRELNKEADKLSKEGLKVSKIFRAELGNERSVKN